ADALGELADGIADVDERESIADGEEFTMPDEGDGRVAQVAERGRQAVVHRGQSPGQAHALDNFGGRAMRAVLAEMAGDMREILQGQLVKVSALERVPKQLEVSRGMIAGAVAG